MEPLKNLLFSQACQEVDYSAQSIDVTPVSSVGCTDGAICICGIDPGQTGAVSFYFPAYSERIAVDDMPLVDKRVDVANLAARIKQMAPDIAVVESVAAMPGQGVSSSFRFGVAFGEVIGVLGALQIPVHLVSAVRWKKHFRLDSDKEKSRAEALRTWPSRHELFARKKDHGRSEAALIAKFGAETLPQFKGRGA